jgi:hypothetical protein
MIVRGELRSLDHHQQSTINDQPKALKTACSTEENALSARKQDLFPVL